MMDIGLKTLPIIVLMIFSGSFTKLECWNTSQIGVSYEDITSQVDVSYKDITSQVDVSYEDINALNATCGGLDSCELPRTPDDLEHCNCGRFCSLLGTCCIDSKHRHKYPKPLKNIHCEYVYDRKIHRFVPMIRSCDPELENDKTTEELCNSNDDVLNDPFLKIPVTDPVTGISYKNYYCFICNENYGAEEPIQWNPELEIKINDLSTRDLRFGASKRDSIRENYSSSTSNLQYDTSKRKWVMKMNISSIPPLHYDAFRKTWVMDYNQENATDVELLASIPKELQNVTPVCYEMVFPIISECASNWTNTNIEEMCQAYMALISIDRSDRFLSRYYRNPHCAICNYESMDDMHCLVEEDSYVTALADANVLFIKLFYLQNKATDCEDNMVYDHFAKKCRRIYRAKRRIKLDI